uniref:HD/PDEase domain-containing protein n=1 Tax=viral metagenome TaxID=1070528 RepID=A0A6C0JAA9_9ZZZZ
MDDDSEYSLDLSLSMEQVLFHDPIHDSFYLPKDICKIIDKPEFQRLRDIKQTGNTNYVYIGAEHTRFSHSIGVAHLCLEFGRRIMNENPSLLTERQIFLLTTAGLVHDLGHCAYSHLYDNYIVPMFEPGSHFCHEQASCDIFSMMIKKYSDLNKIYTENDIKTVQKLIFGSKTKIIDKYKSELKWTQWDVQNMFYYEILANERTGIDVDKFDYLKRDSHYTGVNTTFEPNRLINFYYIDKIYTNNVINYRLNYQSKANEIIEVMWKSRDDLHRRVYQHRVTKCIDIMMIDVIKACINQKIPGTDTMLNKAHNNMESYCMITDSIIRYIAQNVPDAKAIFDRIDNRDLWKTVAVIDSKTILSSDYIFSDITVKIARANLRNKQIYYIYCTDEPNTLSSVFYKELIEYANGECITLRNKLK